MSLYIDKKYINLMSSSLQRFKWTRENLANCRCPLCGDSDKSKIKARGYFYKKGNDFFYRCHNCGVGHNIYNMLDRVVPSLCKQYSLERYTVGENGNSNYKKPSTEELYPFVNEKIEFNTLSHYIPINELDNKHRAIKYLKKRKIPESKWECFGFTDNFNLFAKQFNEKYNFNEEKRLIIFIKNSDGKIVGAQGRTLDNNAKIVKYITIKKDENEQLIFGLDKVDETKPITVVEGPIDSLFLPNCIACLGLSKFIEISKKYNAAIFIIDNEPRNKNVVDTIDNLIDNGNKVCIFPNEITGKDINDMVINFGRKQILEVISNNIFSGPKAKLILNHWKKI